MLREDRQRHGEGSEESSGPMVHFTLEKPYSHAGILASEYLPMLTFSLFCSEFGGQGHIV